MTCDGSASTDSDGSITKYKWDFGDGSPIVEGTVNSVQHTYTAPGTHTVSLTVTDNQEATTTATADAHVRSNPVAVAVATPASANTGDLIEFSGEGSEDPDGGEITYAWSFGTDAAPASAIDKTAAVSYSTHGTKTATLTVTDDEGARASADVSVTVYTYPTAVIAGGDREIMIDGTGSVTVVLNGGQSYDLDDGTTPGLGIRGYTWREGQDDTGTVLGSASTLDRTFNAAGQYTYSLTVTDNENDTASASVTVTVTKALTDPIAVAEAFDSADQMISGINLDPAVANDSVSVRFKGEKSHDPDDGTNPGDGIDVYSWAFSDGETGDRANVTRSFSSTGAVTGTLTVTDNERVDSATDSVTVTVKSLPKIVVTGGGSVFLDRTSNSAEVTLRGGGSYDPDDGTTPGLGIRGYTWREGQDDTGTVLGSASTLDRTFNAAGQYTYSLTVTDNENDTASVTVTVTVHNVQIDPVAVAEAFDSADLMISGINLDPAVVNDSVSVTFKGEKSHDPDDGTNPGDGIDIYSWAFSDGETGDRANVTRSFSSTGAVTGTLTVTDNERVNSAAAAVTVTVKSLPFVDAGGDREVYLSGDPASVTVNLDGGNSYDPDDGSTAGLGISSYEWRSGDTVLGSQSTLDRTFSATGEYTYSLTVTDNENDTATTDVTLTVNPTPQIALELTGPDSITRADDGSYTATITPAGLSLSPAPAFKWKYSATVNYNDLTITKNITAAADTPQSTTWSGTMVNSGTMEVSVTIDGEKFTQSKSVTVNDRAWTTPIPAIKDATYWGGEAPQRLDDLGAIEYNIHYPAATDVGDDDINDTASAVDAAAVSSGPNKGIMYATAFSINAPFKMKFNRHFGLANSPVCWTAFKDANARYASIASRVKAYLGYDDASSGLHSYWRLLIQGDDPKAAIEHYVEAPGLSLIGYEDAVELYLDSTIGNKNNAMRTAKPWYRLTGARVDYDYITLTAEAMEDVTVGVGNSAAFTGAGTHAPDCGVIADYVWDFGDGNSYDWNIADGVILDTLPAAHSYDAAGTYTATLTVTDGWGNTAEDTLTVTASLTDPTPVAVITPEVIFVGDTVTFDGSGSFDADDDENPTAGISAYAWELHRVTENGVETQSLHSEAGDYVMSLTVTDNDLVESGTRNGGALPGDQPKAAPTPTYGKATRTYNLAVHASMHVRILPNPQVESTLVSETSLAIDTEGVPGRNPVTGEDPTTATIYYQVTGGGSGVTIFRTRVSLEIDDDQDWTTNPAHSAVLGEDLYGTGLTTTWDGKGTADEPSDVDSTDDEFSYGVWNAQIKVDIDFDKNTPEPEDYEWEQTYRSGFLPITVYSFPVADAGGNKVVAIDTTTNLVTVSFDGSGSSDPDDGTPQSVDDVITEWEWSFTGTDLTQDAGSDTATTKTVDTPYRTVGINEATLIVTDNDRPTPHEDDDTITVTVMDLEYNAPVEDKQLVLPTIDVDASPLPAELDAPITWTMTIGSTNHSHDTTTAPTTIRIDPFPTENSHFGPNTITATLTYEGVSISEDKSVRLFWNNTRGENGSGNPNWYHFWSQTPASSGPHRWDRLGDRQNCQGADGWFSFTFGHEYFHLCDSVRNNIDKFAKTCLHESEHLRHYNTWWRHLPGEYYGNKDDLDEDGDTIPDDLEEDLGFDKTMADSDLNRTDDNEELANAAELEWDKPDNANRPAAHSQDWSEDGKQWDP